MLLKQEVKRLKINIIQQVECGLSYSYYNWHGQLSFFKEKSDHDVSKLNWRRQWYLFLKQQLESSRRIRYVQINSCDLFLPENVIFYFLFFEGRLAPS